MPGGGELLPRRAHENVRAALTDTRVVVINGARQTGKSTLARLIMDDVAGSELRYLDEAAVRSAAQADPALFVRHDSLLVLDEVQRVPDLLLAIKHQVDVDPRPGRFLLTGSARLSALQEIPDLLPAARRPSSCGRCLRVRSTAPLKTSLMRYSSTAPSRPCPYRPWPN